MICQEQHFYPRSPCGERLRNSLRLIPIILHFYPRSPCGERLAFRVFKSNCFSISIHALLAESDTTAFSMYGALPAFLSTLSLRRATFGGACQAWRGTHFYPRSPCGERLWYSSASSWLRIYFYPRSPCGERHHLSTYRHQDRHFYPRSPCGERPTKKKNQPGMSNISIHALLAESDSPHSINCMTHTHFYPRSPCGERPF